MKYLKFIIVLLILSCSWKVALFANHILGGEIGYKFISQSSGNQTYRITLKLYADCGSSGLASYGALTNANPYIKIYNNGSLVNGIYLEESAMGTDTNITPVCPDYSNATTCTSTGNTIPGVTQFTYTGDVIINQTSTNWIFQFEGSISTGSTPSQAGRTTLIENANVNGGNSLMYLYATLNNVNGINNSSIFNATPTPFFCLNSLQTYNLLASDLDGDNLSFALVPALSGNGINSNSYSNISYYAPYSATNPLPANNFTFSATNGQMDFTPNALVNSVVVQQVTETRNGVQVGTSMREMAFIILDNCQNQGPTDTVINIVNTNYNNTNKTFDVCANAGVATFNMPSTDPDGDNVTMTISNLPNGVTASVTNNQSANPVGHVSVNTASLSAGSYTFFVRLTDDGCPVSVTQNLAYTIVVHPNPVTSISNEVGCYGLPYVWGSHTFTSAVSGISDTFTNQYGCDSVVTLYLTFTSPPTSDNYADEGCGSIVYGGKTYTSSKTFLDTLTFAVSGCDSVYRQVQLTVHPQDTNPHILDTAGCFSNTFEGATYYKNDTLVDTFKSVYGCDSLIRIVHIIVDTFQLSASIVPSDSVYEGEAYTISTYANGNYTYSVNSWTPTAWFSNQHAKSQYGIGSENQVIVVTGTSQYGCVDTAHINLVVLPVDTRVGVPNAFSPNGDGINDQFKIVLPIKRAYTLDQFAVFNRYGQSVYSHSGGREAAWDGTQNGKPCDIGTYYYQIKISFLNSVSRTFKGDVTLIR